MDSRKYQLKKQIIEALKINDDDLYSLLKSQWAHRFGVESLEELKNLDSNQLSQSNHIEDNQDFDQTQNDFFDDVKTMPLKEDNKKEKEIKIDTNKVDKTNEVMNKESFNKKSYEIFDKGNNENKSINTVAEYKIQEKVEALIPLPPKPKYGYLKKWIPSY